MSLKDVEESIATLRDLTEARAYRAENQALRKKIENMDREHQFVLEKKTSEIQNLKTLILQKDREIRDRDSVEIKYKKKKYTPRQFDTLVEKQFDKRADEKIENNINERWKREAPKLTHQALLEELNKYPSSCMPQTRRLIDSIAHAQRNKLLKNRVHWPPWFKNLIESEVQSGINKGLDEEFSKNVENTAQNRLSDLIRIEWPRYIRTTADKFFKKTFQDQLLMLQRPISISCDRCSRVHYYTLTKEDIAILFRKPNIRISCITPGCRDILRPHGIYLSLTEIIQQIVNPPQYLKVRVCEPQSNKTDNNVKS